MKKDFLPRAVVTGQGVMVLSVKEGRFKLDIRKTFFYDEGSETLEQAWRSCGCLITGRVQSQDGQGFEHPI